MPAPNNHAVLKVRLPEPLWRQLKQRAAERRHGHDEYADIIFRYLLHDKTAPPPTSTSPGSSEGAEEEIYFDLQIAATTKQRLAEWSQRERLSLAGFGGGLLGWFLARHERDPRDLAMVHYLSVRLEQTTVLSHTDLVAAIERCEHNTSVRMPPGYFARWLYGRLQPRLAVVAQGNVNVSLTLKMVQEIVELVGTQPRSLS
jgi:hypothetical protein